MITDPVCGVCNSIDTYTYLDACYQSKEYDINIASDRWIWDIL